MAYDEVRMGSMRKDLMAPCKGCQKRHTACHDRCEDFQAFRGRVEQLREYRKQHEGDEVWDPLAPKRRRDL